MPIGIALHHLLALRKLERWEIASHISPAVGMPGNKGYLNVLQLHLEARALPRQVGGASF